MRITVISSSIFSIPIRNYGGLEEIAYRCAKGLAERGHDVVVVAPIGSDVPGCKTIQCLPPGFAEEHAYGGCGWTNQNGENVRWPGYWQQLVERDQQGGQVIIDQSWQGWITEMKAEGKLPRSPILKVCHAPINTMYQTVPPKELVSFVCISEDQKAHFEALFSPRKAKVCYNGIDLDLYKPINTPRTSRYLFLARFSTIKGASIALETCQKTKTQLDLIGDTSITGEPAYYQMCCQMADGMERRIVGGVPRGETVWWYSQAKAFLHPNKLFREPFGLAPIEAQACGLPVIAFDYGAMRETVKHGETGFLVNSEEEMVNLLRCDAVSAIKRVRCREWASQFSIDKMVQQYETLAQQVLEEPW